MNDLREPPRFFSASSAGKIVGVGCTFCAVLLLLAHPAAAHIIDKDPSKPARTEVCWTNLQFGDIRVLPLGLDHILFVLSVLFLESQLSCARGCAGALCGRRSRTTGRLQRPS